MSEMNPQRSAISIAGTIRALIPADHAAALLARDAKMLAEGRKEGTERAAGILDDRAADEMALSTRYRSGSNPWFAHIQVAKIYTASAAAIRAEMGGEA